MPAPSASSSSPDRSSRLLIGLAHLVLAADDADRDGSDLWAYAVTGIGLVTSGLIEADIRWLALHGLVEHRHETTRPNQKRRSFRRALANVISSHSCFVITKAGREYAQSLQSSRPVPGSNGQETPVWFPEERQLRFRDELVIAFEGKRAPTQEPIVHEFHNQAWRRRIASPLALKSSAQLGDAIRGLNTRRKVFTLLFKRDGTGKGVRWLPCDREGNPAENP